MCVRVCVCSLISHVVFMCMCMVAVYNRKQNKMWLPNMMTIGTHLLLFLIANEKLKLATSYHIAVEPQSTLQYNGHIVSIFLFFFHHFTFILNYFRFSSSCSLFSSNLMHYNNEKMNFY